MDAVTICDAPAKIDDRLLLLKALVSASAQFSDGGRTLVVFTGTKSPPPRFSVVRDAEGFPILTDSLRAALTEATHG